MSLTTIDKYLNLVHTRPQSFTQGKLKIITNKSILMKYENQNKCDLGLLYESTYHLLVKDLVSDGNSYFAYERIIKQNSDNAVVTIPIYQGKFVLLNQFRHSMRDYQLCFPRGFGEPNLSINENAIKELREELGVNVLSCSVIGKVIADSGLCGEKVNICLCKITKPKLMYNYEGINNIKITNTEELVSLINSEKLMMAILFLPLAYILHKRILNIIIYNSNPSVMPFSFVKSLFT